ncbi:lytic transglycosylase [Salmonella enterica]|nr:lytic transglycosylase [Salmonella enterica]
MSIKIPVSAQFDAADVKKQIQIINDQIKNLANEVSLASNKKFEPVTLKSKEDLQAFISQMQKLLKVQTELQQKLKQTGQKNPFTADWSKLYGDKAQRIEKLRAALQWMGVEFEDNPAPKPKPPAPGGGAGGAGGGGNPPAPPPSPPRPNQGGWGQQGFNVLGSGLNAMGPVGSVFNNALRSGMAGGAGAGLMGLVGGLAALGVGKIIGAIANKIDKAQDAAIGIDKIYRQIGGIASYTHIKDTIYGAGSALGMDVNEAIGMGSTYARAANLRQGDNLATGMLVSGGMARTYGIDPNMAATVMGGFRGSNIARNDKDLRRIGLLIGETIAKSNAFGKADEMMQAVSQFAVAQARQSLTSPNIAGYGAGMSSLMNMNLPGLDVAGSAALLSRVNSTLSAGGAQGEASQMLTARVGSANGMNPFQLRQMREGGMFATKGSIFGKGGDQSYFSMTRDQLRRNYGAGTDDYYLAMANHMGITIAQARAMDKMDTGMLGSAQRRLESAGLDLSKINPTSLGTITQIQSGRGLGGIAEGYLNAKGKGALSGTEREELLSALGGKDPEKLKDVLTKIAGAHGTVQTEGSQIRDGIAELNNTMTKFADNALPALNIMRMAMVKLTGGSESALRRSYEATEMNERAGAIGSKYKAPLEANQAARDKLIAQGKGRQTAEGYTAFTRLDEERNAILAKQKADMDQARKEAHEMAYGPATALESAGATGNTNVSGSAAVAAAEAQAGAPVTSAATESPGAGMGTMPSGSGPAGNVGGGNIGNMRAVGGGWQRFKSAREGMAGMAGQLLRYQTKKKWGNQKTLRQIINTYAPSNENNTDLYVSQVAKWTNLNPDAAIDLRNPEIMSKVMEAMIRKENGNKGLAAAAGHYDEAIGDAMRNPNNFSAAYPSEVRLAVDVNGPWGSKTAEHTLRPFKQERAWSNR